MEPWRVGISIRILAKFRPEVLEEKHSPPKKQILKRCPDKIKPWTAQFTGIPSAKMVKASAKKTRPFFPDNHRGTIPSRHESLSRDSIPTFGFGPFEILAREEIPREEQHLVAGLGDSSNGATHRVVQPAIFIPAGLPHPRTLNAGIEHEQVALVVGFAMLYTDDGLAVAFVLQVHGQDGFLVGVGKVSRGPVKELRVWTGETVGMDEADDLALYPHRHEEGVQIHRPDPAPLSKLKEKKESINQSINRFMLLLLYIWPINQSIDQRNNWTCRTSFPLFSSAPSGSHPSLHPRSISAWILLIDGIHSPPNSSPKRARSNGKLYMADMTIWIFRYPQLNPKSSSSVAKWPQFVQRLTRATRVSSVQYSRILAIKLNVQEMPGSESVWAKIVPCVSRVAKSKPVSMYETFVAKLLLVLLPPPCPFVAGGGRRSTGASTTLSGMTTRKSSSSAAKLLKSSSIPEMKKNLSIKCHLEHHTMNVQRNNVINLLSI